MSKSPSDRRLILLCAPVDKRSRALVDAATRMNVSLVVVPWQEALQSPACLQNTEADYLRIESPGADVGVRNALIERGGGVATGEWRPGSFWFRGLQSFFSELEPSIVHLKQTHPTRHILAMTDKMEAQHRLESAGLPSPALIPPCTSTNELREAMSERAWHAVFVKPRWGSSGAGVMAYRRMGQRQQLFSTAAFNGDQLQVYKAVQRIEDDACIERLLNAVLRDGAVVQRWIPKATTTEGAFDLRVFVLNGKVALSVARVSTTPLTNLHLNAKRVSVEDVLSKRTVASVYELAERVASLFPGQMAMGIDVMVDREQRPYVLECNAWGDYLPRLYRDGLDSYDLFMRELNHVDTKVRYAR